LSEALAIDVFDVDIASQRGVPNFHNPFSQNTWAQTYTNFELFSVFSPNVAPYSAFPLPVEDRGDLMMGRIWLMVYVNAQELIREVRRRGLKARLPTKREMEALPRNLLPGQFLEHELDAAILVGSPTHTMKVSLAQISRLGYELLDEKSLVDSIAEHLDQASRIHEQIVTQHSAARPAFGIESRSSVL